MDVPLSHRYFSFSLSLPLFAKINKKSFLKCRKKCGIMALSQSKVKSWFSCPCYWPGTSPAAILSFDLLSPVEMEIIAQALEGFSRNAQCLEFNKCKLF